LVERLAVSRLYARDHLAHVLGTFGLLLLLDELVSLAFGPRPIFLDPPAALAGQVTSWARPTPPSASPSWRRAWLPPSSSGG
jgi:branched-chain amino acid transport system permease protein